MRNAWVCGVLGLLSILVFGAAALAYDRTWDNESGDNAWYNPVNWDPDNSTDPTWSSRWDNLTVSWGTPTTTEDVYVNQHQASIKITGPTASASVGLFVLGNWTSGPYDTKSWVQQQGTLSSQGGVVALATPGGQQAIMTVQGDGSLWTTGAQDLKTGAGGNGLLVVQSAGKVEAGSLYVGYSSAGALNVTGGARVESASGYIGFQSGSSGTATVGGLQSVWAVTGPLYVGQSPFAQGSLVVESGATVSIGGLLETAGGSTVQLAGGRLVAQEVSGEGTIDFTAGTLEITGGDLIIGSGQVIGDSLTLNDSQVVDVSGRIVVEVAGSVDSSGGSMLCTQFENSGQASFSAGASVCATASLTNRASLTLEGATLGGGGFTNDFGASMFARGSIDSALTNHGSLGLTGVLYATGSIVNDGTVEIEAGESLTQSGGLHNDGLIELLGGAILGAGEAVNNPGGVIRGEGAITSDLDNDGGLIHANGSSTLVLANLVQGNHNGGELRVEDGAGIRVVADFSNSGSIRLLGGLAAVAGGVLTNTGLIEGSGRVTNLLTNQGTIEAVDGTLEFSALGIQNETSGRLEVDGDARLLFTQGLAANAGDLVLRGGEFETNGHSVTNTGSIIGYGTFSSGGLTNANYVGVGPGQLDVIGPAVNDGTVYIHNESRAVFFGQVSGGGDFTGTGEVVFLAGYSPGSSPDVVHFGGDVTLGSAGALEIEIAGAELGQYDKLVVQARATLDGSLSILLTNGYLPPLGQALEIISAGEIIGTFDAVDGLAIPNGLVWQVVYGDHSVTLQTVPEPATLSLLALGGLALVRRRLK